VRQDYVMCEDEWLAWMADKPILHRLYDERVFSLGFLGDGKLGVQENCDGYFCDELTVDEVTALIEELKMVRDEMVTAREGKTDA